MGRFRARSLVPAEMTSSAQPIEITIPQIALLLICADPTGTLEDGECSVRLGTSGDFLEGEIIIARHPIYQKQCLRKLKAKRIDGLQALPNIVFLPCNKDCKYAEAHQLQGKHDSSIRAAIYLPNVRRRRL